VYRFPVKVERRGDGYVVTVPAIPGCVTGEKSREEALRKVREVLQAFLMQAGPHFAHDASSSSLPWEGADCEYVEFAGPPVFQC